MAGEAAGNAGLAGHVGLFQSALFGETVEHCAQVTHESIGGRTVVFQLFG